MTAVLGVSCFYHDAAAALLVDGRLVAAAQEERFTRRKHDARFPEAAIRWCLADAGLAPGDVDLVAFYEKPLVKLDRVLETALAVAPAGRRRFVEAMPRWLGETLRGADRVRELGLRARVIYAAHHESHAASAFFASPFAEAAVLVNDGVGEWATSTIGHGRGARVDLLDEIRFPHSLGLLYSAVTRYLGFEINEGEYKVMGLAPYGQPRFTDVIRTFVAAGPDGSYRLDLSAFDFLAGDDTIGPAFAERLGRPAREPEAPIEAFHQDVARSMQAVLEEIVLAQARHAHARTGASALCLAGGVALNAVANGRILREGPFRDVWVQPAAGDAGGALGAALVGWHHALGGARGPAMASVAAGPAFSDAEVRAALDRAGLAGEALPDEALCDAVAASLDRGEIVGWFQGRMELGPRALGQRSILADPRRADVRDRVNASVKYREAFRPFAPVVLEERAAAAFDVDRPLPFMTFVVPVREGASLPAITHVDGTARVQTAGPASEPRLRGLLAAFERRTGCATLLNTSFNLRGEPIVCTPDDAVRTFRASALDGLAIGGFWVRRPAGWAPTGAVEAPIAPSLTGRAAFAAWWMRVGRAIAGAQARALLNVVFWALVVPIGAWRRRRGDPLDGGGPGWRPATPSRPERYDRMS